MSDLETDEAFMAKAVEIAARATDEAGALPYGAVVVLDGEVVGEGLNRARALNDPTSHGEVEAIRDACAKLGRPDLTGAVMYTTAEPCAMCVATMLLSGFDRLVFAAGAEDSAKLLQTLAAKDPTARRRFTMAELREEVGKPPEARQMQMARAGVAEAVAVFDAFAASRASD